MRRRKSLCMSISLFLLLSNLPGLAQLSAYTVQNLAFGAFSHGYTGGKVMIASSGTRTAIGDVILVGLGYQYTPAIFEVEAPEGFIINISTGPDTQLTGSNGGAMTLHIDNMDPGTSFISSVAPPARNVVKAGATLSVSGAANNPPGTYSGSFTITFVQE